MKASVLWSALFARERGVHGRLQLAVLLVVAAGAGVAAARSSGFATEGAGLVSLLTGGVLNFDVTALVLASVAGVVRLLVRPAEDHASGWLVGYIASGGSRSTYVVALWGAVVAAILAALVVVLPVFAVTHALAGGGAAPLQRLPRVLLLAPLVLGSLCMFALIIGTVARDTAAALAVLLLLIAVPLAVAAPFFFREMLPEWAATLIFLHLPPRPSGGTLAYVLQHMAYILIVGGVGTWLADRVVARRA
jgi:hypothetical protein